MSVDYNSFENITPIVREYDYIFYGGYEDINNDKDGVGLLVEAWSKICKKYPNIKLLLGGVFPQQRKDQVKYLSIENQVIFEGNIPPDEIPSYLLGSKALLLFRPDSIQAKGGFSTKLGEYLASGTPVLTTNVGEFTIYLKDKVNAFVCEPGDIEGFNSRLEFMLENNNLVSSVGKKGKELAKSTFNYENYTKEMYDFLYK